MHTDRDLRPLLVEPPRSSSLTPSKTSREELQTTSCTPLRLMSVPGGYDGVIPDNAMLRRTKQLIVWEPRVKAPRHAPYRRPMTRRSPTCILLTSPCPLFPPCILRRPYMSSSRLNSRQRVPRADDRALSQDGTWCTAGGGETSAGCDASTASRHLVLECLHYSRSSSTHPTPPLCRDI
ncbi:hypothetical protein B0H13DRAFT_2075951 [Mycena leptocephala]|nr:hypothetical protein B0H13DRAFT_2075951 [Mycena leptocephala]